MERKVAFWQLLHEWLTAHEHPPDQRAVQAERMAREDERAERIARENERLRRRLAELRALTVRAEGDDHDRVG